MGSLLECRAKVSEFEEKIEEHFRNMGWGVRIEYPEPGTSSKTIVAVPVCPKRGIDVEDELMPRDISREWSYKLSMIGNEYGVRVGIPCTVYIQ